MTPVSPVGGEVDVERLREVAEAAMTAPGAWRTQTFVANRSIPVWPRSALPITRSYDEHIATFDPPTVLALLARLEAAESARDEALAAVERVRELAATWLDTGLMLAGEYREAAHHIRAALTPSAPTEEER